MKQEKKDYCVSKLCNFYDGLDEETLRKRLAHILELLDEPMFDRLMEEEGLDPNGYILNRKDELLERIMTLEKVWIYPYLEDERHGVWEYLFKDDEVKELINEALILSCGLFENKEEELGYKVAKKLFDITYVIDEYGDDYHDDQYGEEEEDEEGYEDDRVLSFRKFEKLLDVPSSFYPFFIKSLQKRNDYEAAFLFLKEYVKDETLDLFDPTFLDGYFFYLERKGFDDYSYNNNLERLYMRLSKGSKKSHISYFGFRNNRILICGLKELGKEMDLSGLVKLTNTLNRRYDFDEVIKEAINVYPDDDDLARMAYVPTSHGNSLENVFVYLSIEEVGIEDFSKWDYESYFYPAEIARLGEDDVCLILGLLKHGVKQIPANPYEERICKGQEHYLRLANLEYYPLLDDISYALIEETKKASSRSYKRIAGKARKLTEATEGDMDYVEDLIFTFPNRPALRRAFGVDDEDD